MKIQRGKTYTHRDLKEVDMHVVRILWIRPEGLKLDVVWVNRHYPGVEHSDRVFLNNVDLKNWKEI